MNFCVPPVDKNFTPKETFKDVDVDSIVYLRATINYSTSKTKFYYSLDNQRWTALGSETSLGFNLTVFVGARFGLFIYSTKISGGMADFDWFTTEDQFDEDASSPSSNPSWTRRCSPSPRLCLRRGASKQ